MDRTAELTSRFALIDSNQNGSLEKSELAAVFGEHAESFLQFCDAGDKDGSLTSDEFVNGILGDTKELSDEQFTADWLERMSSCIADAKPAAPAKRVLMVFTSHSKLGDTDAATGWYLPEAAHPHAVFTEAGCKITLASIQGGEPPLDMDSVDATKEDAVCVKFHEDKIVSDSLKIEDCKTEDYDAIFFVGGFGVMWDFPDDPDVHRLVRELYESGKIVSAVCHAPSALVNVKLTNGEYFIKGQEIAGFTNAEEDYTKRRTIVPFTCEDRIKENGGTHKAAGVFGNCVAISGNGGRLITGQNPPSAK